MMLVDDQSSVNKIYVKNALRPYQINTVDREK